MTSTVTHRAEPPFDAQPQAYPGSSAAMRPQPDHGEESYRGSGRLAGKIAIITGADSASDERSPSHTPGRCRRRPILSRRGGGCPCHR